MQGACLPGRLIYRDGCGGRSMTAPTNNRKVSSYRQSTYFRQVCRGRIYASHGVYPLHCIIGAVATGGIYAAPTNRHTILLLPLGRGRGMPRPYCAMIFIAAQSRDDLGFPLGLSAVFIFCQRPRGVSSKGGTSPAALRGHRPRAFAAYPAARWRTYRSR